MSYSVERLKGPLDLFSRKEKGQELPGGIMVTIHSSKVALWLDSNDQQQGTLIRLLKGAPVKLTFMAEPERLRPEVTLVLDTGKPEIISQRRLFTLEAESGKGPKFRIYRNNMSPREAILTITGRGMTREDMVQAISGFKPSHQEE